VGINPMDVRIMPCQLPSELLADIIFGHQGDESMSQGMKGLRLEGALPFFL